MNINDYISFKVAKLLKEKDYDDKCKAYYYNKDLYYHDLGIDNKYLYKKQYLAPTLYNAQKWLRNTHDIHITIDVSADGYWWALYKTDGTYITDFNDLGPNPGGKWDSYEKALDSAIYESLKLI